MTGGPFSFIIQPMNRVFYLIAFSAGGCLCLASAVLAQEGAEKPAAEALAAVSYATKEYGIYFDVPPGWTLNKKPASGLVEVVSSLGYATVNIAVKVLPHRQDVTDFVKDQETTLGLGRGEYAVDLLEAGKLTPDEASVVEELLLDDRAAVKKKREAWEKEQAKKTADAGMDETRFTSLTEESPLFLTRFATKLYDFPEKAKKYFVYYVIGGGIGYRITVSAEREGFFAALGLAREVLLRIKPEALDGGRYALPSDAQIRAAKMGLVIGKVLSNGVPVGGASVKLYDTKESYARREPVYSGRSNYYGEYVLTAVRPGKYYLLEAEGANESGERVRSLQPITGIEIGPGNAVSINVEVVVE